MSELLNKLYIVFEFIFRLIYLNLLWILFTLLGLVVFGFGPSTIALFDTIREWLLNGIGSDKDLFLFYFRSFKKHFKDGNIMGWLVVLYAYMLLVNYRYTNFRQEFVFQFINGATIVIAVVSAVIVAYLYSLYVHYDLEKKDYLKTAIRLAYIQPFPTGLLILWIALSLYLTYSLFPYSILLFMSFLVYGVMGLCFTSFKRNEQILEENKNKEEEE
ncbi:YesL family protein [Fundicoccus sp. Sow4_H7]|uniref:YesL family protein n=1 Tax=Fundicoccus sp. Sow4_H7 TaxID=3438784 RepID=UPI003F9019CC